MIGLRPISAVAHRRWFVIRRARRRFRRSACSQKAGARSSVPSPWSASFQRAARLFPTSSNRTASSRRFRPSRCSPQVDGIIQSVDFQEGQEVRVGQPLFHIDPRPYQNAYDQAVAVLARDSATWVNAKVNSDRYKQLLDARVITFRKKPRCRSRAKRARAPRCRATTRRRAGEIQSRQHVIRAPIAGRTGNLLVKRGNLVRSGGADAARGDQPGAADPRPIRDSVVAAAAHACSTARNGGLPVDGGAGRRGAADAVDRLARCRGHEPGR